MSRVYGYARQHFFFLLGLLPRNCLKAAVLYAIQVSDCPFAPFSYFLLPQRFYFPLTVI